MLAKKQERLASTRLNKTAKWYPARGNFRQTHLLPTRGDQPGTKEGRFNIYMNPSYVGQNKGLHQPPGWVKPPLALKCQGLATTDTQ